MNREELIEQQRELQNRLTGGWLVVFTGTCGYCSADLLDCYTAEELQTKFISGCRKCHKSFVD